MTDYKPQPGERAVFYGPATGSLEVLVADYRGVFERVAHWDPRVPSAHWQPITRVKSGDVMPLDQATQRWAWEYLTTCYGRYRAGQDLEDLATHQLVSREGSPIMHLVPIPEGDTSD